MEARYRTQKEAIQITEQRREGSVGTWPCSLGSKPPGPAAGCGTSGSGPSSRRLLASGSSDAGPTLWLLRRLLAEVRLCVC